MTPPFQLPVLRALIRAMTGMGSGARGSTKACSRSAPLGATATRSIYGSSASIRASSVAASLRILTTCGTRSRVRLGARQAMNSRCRSVEPITAPPITRPTSRPGGKRLASIPSRSHASSGRIRSRPNPTVPSAQVRVSHFRRRNHPQWKASGQQSGRIGRARLAFPYGSWRCLRRP